MNPLELTKSQKKIARQIIEIGLQREFEAGIKKLDNILTEWKHKELDNRAVYLELYGSLTNHDKHIARRYDRMTGSRYLDTIAAQLADEVIVVEELNDFPEDIRDRIIIMSGINNNQ